LLAAKKDLSRKDVTAAIKHISLWLRITISIRSRLRRCFYRMA